MGGPRPAVRESVYGTIPGTYTVANVVLTTRIRVRRAFSRTRSAAATGGRVASATGALGVSAAARGIGTSTASISGRRPHRTTSSTGHRSSSSPQSIRPRLIILLWGVPLLRWSSSSVTYIIVLSTIALVISISVIFIAIAVAILILVVLLLLLGRRRPIVLLGTSRSRRVLSLRRGSLRSRSSAILPVIRHADEASRTPAALYFWARGTTDWNWRACGTEQMSRSNRLLEISVVVAEVWHDKSSVVQRVLMLPLGSRWYGEVLHSLHGSRYRRGRC